MRVCSLASSSKGNCNILHTDTSILVVDMGITLKELEEKFFRLGLDPCNMVGVIVSHEHSDHTKGLKSLSNKYSVPVYCHSDATDGVINKTGILPSKIIRFGDAPFMVGPYMVDPFRVSHDVFCVGFNIFVEKNKISIVTDLGYTTNDIVMRLWNSRLVIIESNHDEQMVISGRYPPILKARILSDKGHLSNINCAKVLANLAQHRVKQVLLAHLSEENNTPDVCYSTICDYLKSVGIEPGVHIKIDIAKPHGVGPIFVLN